MRENFQIGLARVLRYEGGFTDNSHDPGNWTGGDIGKGKLKGTKYGVSAAAFPDLDIKNLTVADVEPIYKRRYWDKIEGDELPSGPDICTLDAGVNSGPPRGVQWLQRGIGGLRVDGDIGPLTIRAAKEAPDKAAIVQRACAARLSFLHGLGSWARWGNGWGRRVADVEVFCVKLAKSAQGVPPTIIVREAKAESEAAQKSAKRHAGGATASGTGAVADAGSHATSGQVTPDQVPHELPLPAPEHAGWLIELALIVGGVALLILCAWFCWRWFVQSTRAKAYGDSIKGAST